MSPASSFTGRTTIRFWALAIRSVMPLRIARYSAVEISLAVHIWLSSASCCWSASTASVRAFVGVAEVSRPETVRRPSRSIAASVTNSSSFTAAMRRTHFFSSLRLLRVHRYEGTAPTLVPDMRVPQRLHMTRPRSR